MCSAMIVALRLHARHNVTVAGPLPASLPMAPPVVSELSRWLFARCSAARTKGARVAKQREMKAPSSAALSVGGGHDELLRRNQELSILNAIAEGLNRAVDLGQALSSALALVA